MREEVERFLEERERAAAEQARARREKHLLDLGICHTEFFDDTPGAKEEDYPKLEEGKRFRRVAVEVTDEEYAAICAKEPEAEEPEARRCNPVSRLLKVLAIVIYAVYFFLGIGMSAQSSSIVMTLSTWFGGAMSGSALLGLSEVIRLLDRNGG